MSRLPLIDNVKKYLKEDKLLPVYFLCGTDTFAIEKAVDDIKKAVQPLVTTDFDFENYSLEKKQNIGPILTAASSFPFGSGKKLVIVKYFENASDKNEFINYLNSPPEFTVLVVVSFVQVKNPTQKLYSLLNDKKYIFEARELRNDEVVQWVRNQADTYGMSIGSEEAQMLIEMSGSKKILIDMQLKKFHSFIGGKGEITESVIQNLSSKTKEFGIFDLQDAIAVGNKRKALEICFNLLDNGKDLVFINSMLSKFVSTISMSLELRKLQPNATTASKMVRTSSYYYQKCLQAKFMQNRQRLYNSAQALLNSEISIKTTSVDQKTVAGILISEMMK